MMKNNYNVKESTNYDNFLLEINNNIEDYDFLDKIISHAAQLITCQIKELNEIPSVSIGQSKQTNSL